MKKLLLIILAFSTSLALATNNPSVRLLPLKSSGMRTRTVAAMPIQLSPAVFEMQRTRNLKLNKSRRNIVEDNLPSEVNLSMNDVPVFDQGRYGTCVAFAVTAAIDAQINKGDYISQLCLLQLSRSVTQNTYWHSLWEGSSIRILLSYISQYGIMTTEDQKKGFCNNVKTYPTTYDEKYLKLKMSPSQYHAHSVNIYKSYRIEPQILFNFTHVYSMGGSSDQILTIGNNSDGWVTPEESFAATRKSIAEGNRVIVEFLFKADNMRVGIKNTDNDTWFMSNDLRSAFSSQHYLTDSNDWYYHQVVIYGYDDNITVQNAAGESQTGVFLVRNSWGEEGPEYMTYDYFKLMALEATSINTTKKTY
ncbi:MAG: hypothetical protein K2X50_00205 [Gammaproteobacteria bacterium]|nr:hypothetical protein [Gammaproteobacteria bacterium]